jgi:hypothetical protein
MIVKEAIDFKRGQTSKKSLNVGEIHSWPKAYSELSEEEKKKAIQNHRDNGKWGKYLEDNWDHIKQMIVSDQFLMEPAHVNLVDTFGENPYEKIGTEPMIDFDEKALQFDVDRKEIDVRNALTINSETAFLTYLGIPDHLIHQVWYDIQRDSIDFEWDSADDEFEPSKEDEEYLIIAQKNFQKYLNDRIQVIKDGFTYYEENDEAIAEEFANGVEEAQFDYDLNKIENE